MITDPSSQTNLYGYWPSTCTIGNNEIIPLEYVISVDGNDDTSNDPAVSVVLKQALDATTFIRHPMVSADLNQSGVYTHQTMLPVADDTLSFVVNFLPKTGYLIKGVEFVPQSNSNPTGAGETVGLGLETPDSGDTTLVINNKDYQSMQLKVSVDYIKYGVNFVRPTTTGYEPKDDYLNPVEYFVANDYLGRKWTDSKVYTVENGSDKKMPVLYTLNGCIGWFPSPTFANSQTLVFAFDDPDAIATYPATLYPIYSEGNSCAGTPYNATTLTFKVTAHGEHLDGLELWQIIGEEDESAGTEADTIRHSFTRDANDVTLFTINIPKIPARQIGVVTESFVPFTFELHAKPSLGYGTPTFEDDGGSPIDTSSLTTLASGSDLEINAAVSLRHYNLVFKYPTDENLFVANKVDGQYSMDWYGTENAVTVENIKSPMLYNSDGCRIGWKVDGTTRSSRKDSSSNIRVVMDDLVAEEDVAGFVNVMVPDVDNPSCTTKHVYKQILNIAGNGVFYLMQNIGDTALTHSFVDDAGTMTLNVPSAYNDEFGDDGKPVLNQGTPVSEETGARLVTKAVPAAGYVLSKIEYTNSTETKTAKDDFEVNVTEDGDWNVVFAKAGPFYITYDLNAIDNLGNDWSANIYLPRGAQKTVKFTNDVLNNVSSVRLLKPVRKNGMCFDGWTTENGVGKYTGANAVIADPDDVRSFSTDKDNPTVLYAAWKSCSDDNVALTIDNKYRQSVELVVYQKFGEDILRHTLGNVYNEIINLDAVSYIDYMDEAKEYTGYDFYVDGENTHVYSSGNAVSEFTVIYTTDLGDKGTVNEDNGVWHLTNEGFRGTPTFMFVPKKAYRLAFNENVGSSEAKAFVGTQGGLIHDWHVDELSVDSDGNWEPYITYFDTDDNKTFPKIYYRVGYCSDGYTFDPDDATNGVYTELDNDFIKKYNELGKTGEIVLYAHWKSCDNKYYTVTSPDLKYGTMSLLRHSDSYYLNMNSEREYPITAGGLKIPYVKNANNEALDVFFDEFRFEGKGDYDQLYFGKLDFLYYRAKGSDSWVSVEKDSDEKIEKYGLNNASVYDYFEVNADMEVSVRFGKHFLANASNDEVFFGPNWVWDGFYGIGDVVDDKAFSAVPDVGRAGACVVGWGEPIKDADYLVLFDDIDAMIDASAFYAIWNDTKLGGTVGAHLSFNPMDPNLLQQIGCDTTTYTITSTLKQNDHEPMLILTQAVGDSVFSHWVGESGLKVPAYLKNMKFSADVEHFDNYAAKAIYVMDTQGNVLDTVAPGEPFEIKGNTVIKVDLGKGDGSSIHVSLNENSDDPIYFGNDWTDEISYEGGDSVVLPTIAYNSEKCLAGWMVDSTSNELLTVLDNNVLRDLRAKGKAQGVGIGALLYAKWTSNLDSCAGDFMKLAIEQENGSVWFAEGDKDKTIERRFTEEGTMFVPLELSGRSFRVQATGVDTSVYVLDSLVVLRNRKVDTVLFVGDFMPENLDSSVTLKAYFGWKNKTELNFVKKRLARSGGGAMFKLNFTASDFEVRRKVSARVKIFDMAKDSVIKTYAFGDSVAMGFDTAFVFRMDKPGNYRMLLELKDHSDSVKYEEEFSIDPVISSIAVDSWQMLSLSAVDMPAITWDGDQIFYWWDEQGTGEFWQYKQLTEEDSLDGTRGVWYSSLEGRPLPLNFDVNDEGEDFVWKLDYVNSGWNLVANPHGWTVDLFANYPDAIKDVDEESEVTFYKWDAEKGDYEQVLKDLGPYEAVWAQVSKKTKWKVSAAPVFDSLMTAAEKSRALVKASTKDRWTLRVKLSDQNGKQDSWNILGAGLNPVAAEEPPEGMGDHVNLSIVEGKRALAKSIKESSNELEWTIALSASSDRMGYLSFEGIDGIKDYGYRVFVTVDGNTTEMQDGVPLTVYLKSSAKTATVRVAPSAKVVAKNVLKGLRMARLGNQLRVSFDASESLAGTNARVDILDMKGHVMSTVAAKTLEGSNALVLDAPQTGLYMLRVRAGSEQQVKKIVVK